MLRIKRTYDSPARGDGRRILVERLWPRGLTKEAVAADGWLKDVAPSTELRRWFDHRVERWDEFQRRYRDELNANPHSWKPIVEAAERGNVTLLYSAHDAAHNGALVLREYLEQRRAGPHHQSPKGEGHRRGSTTTGPERRDRSTKPGARSSR